MYNAENVLICKLAGYLVCGVSVLNWSDATVPRTDTPVRFVWQWGTALFPRASWTVRPSTISR